MTQSGHDQGGSHKSRAYLPRPAFTCIKRHLKIIFSPTYSLYTIQLCGNLPQDTGILNSRSRNLQC